jgi:filamentous hemagglutinin family protein
LSDQALVAVSRKQREGTGHTLLAITLLLCARTAQAAPVGGQIASGSGAISQAGAETTATQSGPALSLNWKSFNIGPQETVTFVQPSTAAVAVNHISDLNGTQILGHLNANGQVYLINPNGILFARTLTSMWADWSPPPLT